MYLMRDVHLNDVAKKALALHDTRFAASYIFLNTQGGPHLDTDMFNNSWKDALKKSEVRYRIPYTCRHTRAAMMLTAGINPAFAANQLGHTVEMFFRIYSSWINELGDAEQIEKLAGVGPLLAEKNKGLSKPL
jgi:integrase